MDGEIWKRQRQLRERMNRARATSLRQEAKIYLKDKIAEDGRTYRQHHLLAPLLQADGDAESALKHLKIAVLANPHCIETRNDMALAIFKLGHWRRAIEEFERCLAINPGHGLAHKNLASVYASRGVYDKALHHAEEAARLAPYDAMAQRNLARIYDAIGDSRRAIEHNAAAIRLGPGIRCVSDPADAQAYRRFAVLAVGRGETRTKFAHEHYDAYRALTHQDFVLPDSTKSYELLLKAKQQTIP